MAQPSNVEKIGLYIHIPFCDQLCHYCDFVKTAWHEPAQQQTYLDAVLQRCQDFLEHWQEFAPEGSRLGSVFFGGGTPSVLTGAYAPLLTILRPFLAADAEITLEANPEHALPKNLEIWSKLGINRLSLGVQSFDSEGLRFLTRSHSPDAARSAVRQAQEFFKNINIDLIYAWPGQEETSWLRDLEQALALGVSHLSLYSLTFEGRTPLARRVRRGVLDPMADEQQERLYQLARMYLGKAAWVQEEVSNWARPGFETVHNAIYWNGGSYLGVGAGAHSYLENLGPWGLRFQQSGNWKKFIPSDSDRSHLGMRDFLSGDEYEIEAERDANSWLLEVVSSGLRTRRGINLDAICAKSGYSWVPNHVIQMALTQGSLTIDAGGQCRLHPEEWYRETRWSLEVALSFVESSSVAK